MKIAVLADIHANLAALQAVIDDIELWRPDTVVVAGDIVNRGPQSDACLDLTLQMAAERGWRLIRGNHERYVLNYAHETARPDFPRSGPHYEMSLIIRWAQRQVLGRLPEVADLPQHLHLSLGDGDGTLAVYHASLRHDRDGIGRHSDDASLRAQIDTAATIFCVGHTHMPFVRRVDGTLLVNVGAVGLPFDGDTRASYARLTRGREGWEATIRRVPYDLDTTLRAFMQNGTYEAVGAHAPILFHELRLGRSFMFDFIPLYHGRILAGEIGMVEAVDEFLRAAGLER